MRELLWKKLKEPSTWRGIGGFIVALGLASVGSVDAVIAAGMAIVSAVEIIRRENGGEK